MAVELSAQHQKIIDARSGRPSHSIKLFDTTAAWNSKGFVVTYYKILSTPENPRTAIGQNPTYLFGEESIVDQVWGIPIRTHHEHQLRFDWGKGGLPDGIREQDLEEDRVWGAVFDGYMIIDDDVLELDSENVIFNVMCPVFAKIWINGAPLNEGVFPNGFQSTSSKISVYLIQIVVV